jgi:hypothetical protein
MTPNSEPSWLWFQTDFRPRALAAGVKACKDMQVGVHVGEEDARSD